MADFHQNGTITTLHRLTGDHNLEALSYVKQEKHGQAIALVLPCLVSECEGTALPRIVDEISKLDWLGRIIVGIDGASAESFNSAREIFAKLPQNKTIVWNDDPAMKAFDSTLGIGNISGKGSNLWRCIGVATNFQEISTLVFHDADVTTYDGSFVAKLAHPIIDSRMGFNFVKGFYPRFDNNGFNGRLTRLLVNPLLESLSIADPGNDQLRFLQAFRYPLAGEFAIERSLAASLPMPVHWGVDIAMLSTMRTRGCRVAQTDLTDRYDHKHQSLSTEDPNTGLHRMAREVISTIFDAAGGSTIDPKVFKDNIDNAVIANRVNAISNGLPSNSAQEEAAAKLFASLVQEPLPSLPNDLPSWEVIQSEAPGRCADLLSIVESQSISEGRI